MATYVHKKLDDTIHVLALGETVVLDDGTKIPYGNLDGYSPQVLAAFRLYAFSDPTPPAGKFTESVEYVATSEGVDQVPTFADLPVGPRPDESRAAAFRTFRSSLLRKGRSLRSRGDVAGAVDLFLKAAGVSQ